MQKCEQLLAHETTVEEKDAEIPCLKPQREVPDIYANFSNDMIESSVLS